MTEILSWNLSREMECIQYASKELLNSKEIAMTAVKQNGNSIQYVGEDCQRDREIVLEAVKRNGECLEFLRSQFAKDKEIVMEAAKQKGFQFKFVDESLRGDGEIIMEMVKRYGFEICKKSFTDGEERIFNDGNSEQSRGNEICGEWVERSSRNCLDFNISISNN
jgi:hypothetical protein